MILSSPRVVGGGPSLALDLPAGGNDSKAVEVRSLSRLAAASTLPLRTLLDLGSVVSYISRALV